MNLLKTCLGVVPSLTLVVLSGCLDITTTTELKSDGAVVRTIVFSGDSAEVHRGNFPVELDSLWLTSIARVKDKTYALTATRTFRDAGELNDALGGAFGKTLQHHFVVEKSFQWFFTIYRYKEEVLPFAQFTSIPLSDYLSESEIAWLKERLSPGDSTKEMKLKADSLIFERLEPRGEEWERQNKFQSIFQAFLDGVKTLNDPSLTAQAVLSARNLLYDRSRPAIEKDNFDTLRVVFRSAMKTSLVDKAWQISGAAIEELKRRADFEKKTSSHKYVANVVMPGIITQSNALKIEGNTATWEDYKDFAKIFGYTMEIESRRVNWWAVVIAAVVVLALVTLLVASLLRKRVR